MNGFKWNAHLERSGKEQRMTATGYFGIRAKITIVDRTLRLTRPNGNGYGEEQYKEKCPSKDVDQHVDQRENKIFCIFARCVCVRTI